MELVYISVYRMFRLTTILLFFLPAIAAGQIPVIFQHLNSAHGLSDNNVNAIVSDKNGFLWVGTDKGLNVYDGKSVSLFAKPNSGSLVDEEITALFCDSFNRVWVGTPAGVVLIDEKRQMKKVELSDTFKNYSVKEILYTQSLGIIIFSNKGNFFLNTKSKRWEKIPFFSQQQFKNRAVDISSFSPNQILMCDEFESILLVDFVQKKELWRLPVKYIVTAARLNDSTILASTFTGIIYFINSHTQKIQKTFTLSTFSKSTRASVSIVKMRPLPNGKFIFTTYYDGLLLLNPTNLQFEQFTHEFKNPVSLSGNRTKEIYCDNKGNVFISIENFGLSYFNIYRKTVNNINVLQNRSGDFFDGPVNMITKDKDGIYWMAASDRLMRWDADKNSTEFYYYSYPRKGVAAHKAIEIFSVCVDHNNNVWVGTAGGGIGLLNKSKGSFEIFSTEFRNKDSALQSNYIRQMAKDEEGNIWAVTNRGVVQLDPQQRVLNSLKNYPELGVLAKKRLYSIYIDRQQNIWLGGSNTGAYKWNRQKHSLKQFNLQNGLPSLQCNDFLQLKNGDMYIATTKGLAHLRGDRVLKVYQQGNGLRYLNCQALQSDDEERVWIANDNCMIAFDPQKKSFHYFDKKNGFSNFGFRVRAAYKSEDEKLYWGGEQGFSYFNPSALISDRFLLNPLVFKIRIGDSTRFVSSNTTIKLPASSNNLVFYFSSVNVLGNSNIVYKYRLAGVERQWNQVVDQHEVHYSTLQPGNYQFQLMASADGMNWVQAPYEVRVQIVPPFWKTSWFMVTVIALLLLGLYLWIRSLLIKVREEKILTYFATSLYGQNTVDDIFWDIAKNCISQLKLEDCVIYQYDATHKKLVQRAAYGPKNPAKHEIINPIEIPLGKGVVGAVAKMQQPIIVKNTLKNDGYIVDDKERSSEVAVPLFINGKLFGVIDSEHSQINFYRQWHLRVLQKIAAICSDKISKHLAIEQVRTTIARDLHDEIGSALSSINVFSKVAISKSNGNAALAGYLNLIKQTAATSMDNMSDIVWAINPLNDKLEALVSRMKELASGICEALDIELEFSMPEELETITLDLTGRKNLFLIFKEALNNAVKYSNGKIIQTRFSNVNNKLVMEICDNGIGYTIEDLFKGNGLRNMQDRVAECEGIIQFNSSAGKGFMVRAEIPIPQFGEIISSKPG